jgi:hypothetical protein
LKTSLLGESLFSLRQNADLVQITGWACQLEADSWRRVVRLTDGAEGRYRNSALGHHIDNIGNPLGLLSWTRAPSAPAELILVRIGSKRGIYACLQRAQQARYVAQLHSR